MQQKNIINDILEKNNLAGVIVLYNPDSSTIDNIATYINYLSHLYVINNSESTDLSLISKICNINSNISYHPFGHNLGIAKALNEGCTLAIADGYKWILTMDQDSHFEDNGFFTATFNNSYINTVIIAASYNNIYFNPKPSIYPNFTEVDFVITSGNILNLAAWQEAGRFIDKLFIDEVDNEFCIRAVNKGFKVLVTNNIYLLHKLGDVLIANHILTGKQIALTKHSPLRIYYMVRNNVFIWRKFIFSNFGFVLNRIKNIIYLFSKILLYFPGKKEYLRYTFMALGDSFKGKYGKFGK